MNMLKALFSSAPSFLNVDAAEANQMLNSKTPPFLLDVRSEPEFRQARIQGAKLIPLDNLARQMGDLPKDRVILVVCRSGGRSSAAARELAAAGYEVVNLRGGMNDWQGAGLPIRKG